MKDKKYDVRTYGEVAEIRTLESGGTNIVSGYALKFDTLSHDFGYGDDHVYETLDKRCLDETDMSNVAALINHDANMLLGRIGFNLELRTDDIGLYFEVRPTDTSYAKDLITNMQSGIIAKCSFGFVPDPNSIEWSKRADGSYLRTIKKIKQLFDVSVVTYPAYEDTESVVSQRSFEAFRAEELKNNQRDVEAREQEIEIMKMYMQQAGV
ncbi:HK97 family phage prohead protease [Abiotrophia defectiva]|uniref:HK97 family phage prohead protease n=1 Tax=Abiotrophia defectiva TaxID=46125 RepID=UPI0028CFF61C|nr:HK97 family phage prohead protease [Abiotrophia defectiva]